jgi:hypothetical protein
MTITTNPPAPGADTPDDQPDDHGQHEPKDAAGTEENETAQAEEPAGADGRRLPAWLTERTATREAITTHLDRARTRTWDWLRAAELADDHFCEQVLQARRDKRQRQIDDLYRRHDQISRQIADVHNHSTGATLPDGSRSHAPSPRQATSGMRAELNRIEARIQTLQATAGGDDLPPRPKEIRLARLREQLKRACILGGAVAGGEVLLPMHDVRWLLASLPAAAIALWRAGARADEDPADTGAVLPRQVASAVMFQQAAPGVPADQVPAGAADGTPVAVEDLTTETGPTPELTEVEEASHAWLMERLVEAGIVTRESSKLAKIVSMVVQGPGWTATVQLPPGKKADSAIARSGELASALTRKSSQIEMTVDTSEEGHEGRFTMWVSDRANPYAGPAARSVLVDAERWDFWEQGIPLGADARGIRKLLRLLWSSLMVGGLQRYGKTFFVRLIAAAAALDPNVRIVLVSGKPSPDWLALKKIAVRHVVGFTPDKIREAYETICWAIDDLQERGEALTALAERDPLAVPEGKVTRELARSKDFGLTLLIVDELQNLLIAAQTVKSGTRPNDPAYASMIRDKLAVFNRLTSSQGGMAVAVVHRPGPDSPVTTDLRDAYAARASYRVRGIDSARNVLGPDAVAAGAAPHGLLEVHKGVAVVDLGEDEGHFTILADLITLEEFGAICTRGRLLRQEAGTLTGYAAESADAEQADTDRRTLISAVADAITAADAQATGGRLEDLAPALAAADPARWDGLTPQRLGELLREAGAGNTVKLPRQPDSSRPNGYRLDTLQDLLRRSSTAA